MKRRQLLALPVLPIAGAVARHACAREAEYSDELWRDEARQRNLPLRLRWPDGTASCGLVVHSHGLGGSREGGDLWGRAWRDAGLAVLHVQHPGSDIETLRAGGLRAARAAASGEQLRARVADVQFVVGEALRRAAVGALGWARLRPEAIGASGHSFGAHTVQALAGQRFAARAGDASGTVDARLRAFIAFSPSLGHGPRDAFAGVTRPFLAVTGSHDESPLDSAISGVERARVYDALPPGRRALLWIDGADHMSFGGNGQALSRRAARALRRVPSAERDEALHHERIARITSHWWRTTLLGEPMRAPDGLGAADAWRSD